MGGVPSWGILENAADIDKIYEDVFHSNEFWAVHVEQDSNTSTPLIGKIEPWKSPMYRMKGVMRVRATDKLGAYAVALKNLEEKLEEKSWT
jgi:hypothetical protein